MTPRASLLLASAAVLLSLPGAGQTLPVQQLTPSDDAISQRWSNRTSTLSSGKVVFAGSNETVYLYDGNAVQTVQPTTGKAVRETVLMLGSGSTAGSVIGAWRRGDEGEGWVSAGGGTPHLIDLNAEHVSIGSGCVFMTLQTAANGNQAFSIDPASGTRTQISTDPAAANHGAFRIHSDGCTKVAWSWLNPSNLYDIQYWNGSSVTTVATDVDLNFSFARGQLVYTKAVGGIQQVFAIDTAGPMTPVQLSSETDAAKQLAPQTDGRHVAWFRANADGSQATLVLNGGLAFPTGHLGKFGNDNPFELNRGQLLWTDGAAQATVYYDDGAQRRILNPAPATAILLPWLTDGSIAFLGPTATSGTDNEVFLAAGTVPSAATQPAPPLYVTAAAGSGQVLVDWDRILGATSYNLYVATAPGVTSANYASLPGGMRVTGASPPYTITLPADNHTYYFAVSAVDGSGEGASSRTAAATLTGTLAWQSVGGLATSTFYSVAADPADWLRAYAGSSGSVYRSADGGVTWTQALSSATTAATRIAALALNGTNVLANAMRQADVWRSADSGDHWTRTLDASGFGEAAGALAIDPADSNTIYAADYILPGKTSTESLIIKSIDGGTNWAFTPEAPGFSDELHAYALAIDPSHPQTVYAGGSGTPDVAKSLDGAASWTDVPIGGNHGGVYSLAIDPANPWILYAATRDLGVFKSSDGASTWTAKSTGLTGAATSSFTGFNSILVDPANSNHLHLGAGNGYWTSIDGGETWTAANDGFGVTPPYIYGLARSPSGRLFAATDHGLYMLDVEGPPSPLTVTPNTGDIEGGVSITITGAHFQPSASVAFGGAAATNVLVPDGSTITATTPPHSAGVVSVVVTNVGGAAGTLANAFTYTNNPPLAPANVVAEAQSTTSVHVSWDAPAHATSYEIDRRDPGGVFHQIDTSSTNSYDDIGLPEFTAHLYRVRAVNSGGTSPDSAADLATTVIFTDEALAGIPVKALHLAQLRTAVNAVRHLQGLGDASVTGTGAAGTAIQAAQITELRTALDAARGPLGFPTGGYTDTSLTGVAVKAIHFQELRNRTK